MSTINGRRFTVCVLVNVVLVGTVLVRRSDALKGWAFLANQTDCKLSCQNGGVCAFNTETPDEHKCICFIGMFYGEQCEFPVPDDAENEMASEDEKKIDVEESISESDSVLEDSDSAHLKPTLTVEEGEGVGGSLGGDDSDLGGIVKINEEGREELSYESELLLNGKSTAAPVDVYATKKADEVELLKNLDSSEYGNNVIVPNGDEYSHVDVTPAPTVAEPLLGYHEYRNNLAAPAEFTTPLYSSAANAQEREREEELEATTGAVDVLAPPTDAYTDTSTGAGGSFLSADDGEAQIFHANSNLKQYESTRTTHRIDADRARLTTTLGNEVSLDASPHASRRRGGAGDGKRKSRVRTTTTTVRPAYGGDESEEEESYDDGWMMSAKRRSAPSAAPHLWAALDARLVTLCVSVLLFTIFRHI